eukprot:CAMPEP_0179220350 /NCGR_PEP_ID=MMETSP0797-20121207/5565_1 /TAXON_ID=47934 /ORGANISM="Dinophysis acuminata, Strain DAEP01" /LENGTH=136 /DNA_ID=CAMNT_0020926969 /DNA_START=51 /DNA_END=465 /DNA_ORIENTATION=-
MTRDITYRGGATRGMEANGRGTGTWGDGVDFVAGSYTGDWKDNEPDGEGAIAYTTAGVPTYTGTFKRGRLMKGIHTIPGGKYDGTFTDTGDHWNGIRYDRKGKPVATVKDGEDMYINMDNLWPYMKFWEESSLVLS